MKLLILIAVLGVVYGEYLDEDHCEKGPTLWCSNLHYAKRCGAVKHCMDTVWTKQIVKGSQGDASCTVCQLMVNNARQLLKNKATEVEVESLLAKACYMMPSKVVGKGCKQAVKDYLPEILNLIQNEKLDSKIVCSLMGMCLGTENTAVRQDVFVPAIPEISSTEDNDKLCVDCTNFFNDIRDMITSNDTEEQFKDFIENILCGSLGGLQGMCKELVEQFTPMIFKYLSGEFNVTEICSAIQFCKTQANYGILEDFVKSKTSSSDKCDICHDVINELRSIDRNPAVQSEIINLLEGRVCPLLGASKDICVQYVKAYAPVLFQLLASELDPIKICAEVGMCLSNQVEIEPVLLTVSSPVYHVVKPDYSRPPAGKLDASIECVVCEFVLKEVDEELKGNKSVAAITKALKEVCGILPATIRTECVAFVNQYTAVIVALLSQEIDPKVICVNIGICKKSVLNHRLSKPTIPNVLKPISGDPLVCEACKQVVAEIDNFVKENSTTEDIEMFLEKVCSILPQVYRKQCDTIVDSYGPFIIQLLTQLADPKKVCEALTMCTPNLKKPDTLFFKPHMLGNKKCTFGPAYWCASHENARNCKAVEHCQKHVWNN